MGIIYYLSSAKTIIFLPKMDFHQQDIRQFLLESIPYRFKQLSPPVFEDFIRYLFEVDGYDLPAADKAVESKGLIMAQKDDTSLVIMPLRSNAEEVIGEDMIEKAILSRELLDTDQSWIITTASFSPEARLLAEESDIELWDWEALYLALCQLFFQGKTHLEYLEQHPMPLSTKELEPELRLKVKWQAAEGVGTEWYNLGVTVTNPTDRNIYLHLELPALIDNRRNQVMADQWVDGEFVSGMLYAGASIRTNALFSVARLGDRPPGGRGVVTCHERIEVPVTYHLEARLKGEACYVVTYCYSVDSKEYMIMTAYRDQVLAYTRLGRLLISAYYYISPHLVHWAARNKYVDHVLRKAADLFIPSLMRRAACRIKSNLL